MLVMNGTNVNFYAESKDTDNEVTLASMNATVTGNSLSINFNIMDLAAYEEAKETVDADMDAFRTKVVDSASAL